MQNKLNADLKDARAEYYKNRFLAVSNDPKKVLNTLCSLTGQEQNSIPSTLVTEGVSYS